MRHQRIFTYGKVRHQRVGGAPCRRWNFTYGKVPHQRVGGVPWTLSTNVIVGGEKKRSMQTKVAHQRDRWWSFLRALMRFFGSLFWRNFRIFGVPDGHHRNGPNCGPGFEGEKTPITLARCARRGSFWEPFLADFPDFWRPGRPP